MRVLVTRVEPAATALAAVLRADGHAVDVCPALFIVPVPVPSATLAAARAADAWFFVSVPSVEIGWPLLGKAGEPGAAPISYAVGPATAAALRARGVVAEQAPGSGSAEQLLTLPSLSSMHGRHCAIVRGQGGLATLPETLAARGAQVTLLEVYARQPLTAPALRAAWHAPDRVLAASGDAAQALVAAADAAGLGEALRSVPMLVPSERVAALARALGVMRVIVCDGADDSAVRAALARPLD